ncbi:acyl-coenzyme A thioesterase PaaI-like protein [Amycolatopsis bartoniae]|uniref:Thioesterase domain-containing protein n=1 Tax=Amycolatopsis bartoniae TaxID=941986 RepID=A0A8H9M7S3_9PSEU|nr:PaaI family thioesterase [Amycolatopsis bartoniae]MBB2939931.1 acyl-coenzyme A thioesterase PaaI-like protein [Amycolatopsis bartoniae]TVT08285.1 PaaI family thioesterase [Amycolatopsis bartoniae]GHF35626.1 hypothetical protein GCM10017566_05640 [Amycolatopsis bartoniae]
MNSGVEDTGELTAPREWQYCSGCRPQGACRVGLVRWLEEDGSVSGRITFAKDVEGGPGVIHGGYAAVVFDELLGTATTGPAGVPVAVTKSLTVHYRRPIPIEQPIVLRAWRVRTLGRDMLIDGEMRLASSGALLATAESVFTAVTDRHFQRHQEWLAQQRPA